MDKKKGKMSFEAFHLGHDILNQQLEKSVLEEMQRGNQKKEQHSNIGGWQSERDLHVKLGGDTPYAKQLLELFVSFSSPMMQYINTYYEHYNVKPNATYDWNYMGAWFNVAAQGGYNAPHVHPESQISAAYYVRTEQPSAEYPFSGRVDFIQDNITYPIFPKPGTLILFPGSMLHFVHPYYGSGHRISLSFNVNNVHVLDG